jgi:ubiquitin carboxyl-terminal hydrolase 16/45
MVKNEDNSTDSETQLDKNDEKSSGCPHLVKSLDSTKLKKILKSSGLAKSCSDCNKPDLPKAEENNDEFLTDETLWLCMRCGVQLCGRAKRQHALSHFEVNI